MDEHDWKKIFKTKEPTQLELFHTYTVGNNIFWYCAGAVSMLGALLLIGMYVPLP